MAEAMTYNSLVEDIETYTERNDSPFLEQVPRFIMLAENRIASEVHGLGYIKFANGTFSAGNNVLDKPSRWRETISLYALVNGNAEFLRQRSYTYCKSYWPNSSETGIPKYYSDYDYEHYLIVATPDNSYTFEVAYHERPLPLDNTNQTNWTTRYAPQLLLYAALIEAQVFLKLQDRVAEFENLYSKAAAGVTQEAQRRMFGDQALSRTVG